MTFETKKRVDLNLIDNEVFAVLYVYHHDFATN